MNPELFFSPEELLDWFNCNLAAAAAEVRETLTTMVEVGKQEEPNSTLVMPKNIVSALESFVSTPTTSNAQNLCQLLPMFRNIFIFHCPKGEPFRLGTQLGASVAQACEIPVDDIRAGLTLQLAYPLSDLRVRESLLLSYWALRLVRNTKEIEDAAFQTGFRQQLANSLCLAGTLSGDLPHAENVFEQMFHNFAKAQPSSEYEIDDSYLRRFEMSVANGRLEVAALYHQRLASLLGALMTGADQLVWLGNAM